MPTYPNPDAILNPPLLHKKSVVRLVLDWKRDDWYPARHSTPDAKFNAIVRLVERLADEHHLTVYTRFAPGMPDCYRADENLIYLSKPSIITALHEFAHALYGADETQACRWSVQLFRKTFPKAFAQLDWQGHMLIKSN